MNPVTFLIDYIRWHYGSGIFDLLRVWGNLIWFIGHFFSTPLLLRTLFSPFMRLHEKYPEKGHFDMGYWAGTLLINMLMRIVGILVRLVFILISFLLMFVSIVLGVLFVAFWIIAPVGIVVLIMTGLSLISFA